MENARDLFTIPFFGGLQQDANAYLPSIVLLRKNGHPHQPGYFLIHDTSTLKGKARRILERLIPETSRMGSNARPPLHNACTPTSNLQSDDLVG